MSRFHVAVVAPPWYPVPPAGYGGTELVVHLLVGELRRRDVDVTLYAAEGSSHEAVELAPSAWAQDLGGMYQQHRETTYLGRVLDAIDRDQPDIVHDHAGWSSPLVMGAACRDIPVLHTIHGPLYEVHTSLYSAIGKRTGFVAISDAQRDFAPSLNWAGTVHNSVDIDALVVGSRDEKDDYLLCLARISPEKGQHVAIEVARRAGRPLVLAGKVGEQPAEQKYFETQVLPHVDGKQVTYIPNVSGRQKAQTLARAHALISPLQWPEPFGLAMVEAMASGTPCVAFDKGAAPEIIDQGVTGYLCQDVDSMLLALEGVDEIDPVACARQARRRFSPAVMADRYLALYEAALTSTPHVEVIGSGTAPALAFTADSEAVAPAI